jgi:lipooligosaccharide transport system ATP-binding protein
MTIHNHTSIVTARGLRKSFDDSPAVAGVDFDVFRGECLGVLGPNGAGKTTTLRMLLGLAIPDAGTLSVLNYSLPKQAREMRTKIGVVPQQDNLDPDFTVIENLFTYASYFGLQRKKIKNYVNELLVFAALETRAKAKIGTLSGGMKRRLILARALINQPELLVLDEPTTGLDPQARQLIWQRLRTLKNKGTTLILTTHYMEEAQRLCDRILIMDQGTILSEGKPHELISQYIEPYVFEVHGDDVDAWQEHANSIPNLRVERVGETLFCYTKEEQVLLQELARWPKLEFMRRPGNLEDVFIKLTGRELRENA